MRVVLVPKARPLAPFDRPADGCRLGGRTLATYRVRTLAALGLPAATPAMLDDELVGPALVLSDEVFATRRALRGFLRATRRESTPIRLALPSSRLLELTLPLQDVDVGRDGRAAFDVAFLPAGVRGRPRELFSLDEERWREPPYRELPLEVPLPRYLLGRGAGGFTFPLTSSVVMRVRHWVHVLRAGHLMPQIALLERAEDRKLGALLRAAASVRFSRAATLRALKARFVYRGRGGFVHPTATVEASVLGDDVFIGAYSYVVGSVLGDGAILEQRAHVEQSCLGPRTFVSKNSSVSACVAFGDTDVCTNGIQTCVIAERCGLTSWARPLDTVSGGEVKVRDEGALRAVGELPCGAAFGPGVFVGAEVNIGPGRAVPPGVRLVGDPSRTLLKVDEEAPPGLYALRDGGLCRIA